MLAQRVRQPAASELPVRLGVVQQLGERDAGAQRRGGRWTTRPAGPRRAPGRAGRRPTPAPTRCRRRAAAWPPPSRDRAARSASTGPTNARVAAYQPVVPHPHRDVGRHVGLAAGVLDPAGRRASAATSRPPAAFEQPVEGPRGRRVPPATAAPWRTRRGSRRRLCRRAPRDRRRRAPARPRSRPRSRPAPQEVSTGRVSSACGSRAPGSCRSPDRAAARPAASPAAAS